LLSNEKAHRLQTSPAPSAGVSRPAAVMEVNSWLTGRRGVSLPSRRCAPLCPDADSFAGSFKRCWNLPGPARGTTWSVAAARPGSTRRRLRRPSTVTDSIWMPAKLRCGPGSAARRAGRSEGGAQRPDRRIHQGIGRGPDVLRVSVPDPPATRSAGAAVSLLREHPSPLLSGSGLVVLVRAPRGAGSRAVFFQFGTTAIYKFGASNETGNTCAPTTL